MKRTLIIFDQRDDNHFWIANYFYYCPLFKPAPHCCLLQSLISEAPSTLHSLPSGSALIAIVLSLRCIPVPQGLEHESQGPKGVQTQSFGLWILGLLEGNLPWCWVTLLTSSLYIVLCERVMRRVRRYGIKVSAIVRFCNRYIIIYTIVHNMLVIELNQFKVLNSKHIKISKKVEEKYLSFMFQRYRWPM